MKVKTIAMTDLNGFVELAIVIDVIRAFTTAAYALGAGAEKIILVQETVEAFRLRQQNPDWMLMGEQKARIPGFDFGNSPLEVFRGSVLGKTLVQRTSCGTQGVWRAKEAKKVLISSFAVAAATYRKILSLQPDQITFVVTNPDGDEDWALAEYLEAQIRSSGMVDPAPFLDRVRNSPSGRAFTTKDFPAEDLEAICSIDRFNFAIEVKRNGPLLAARRARTCGLPE